jgi:hypothetical protein
MQRQHGSSPVWRGIRRSAKVTTVVANLVSSPSWRVLQSVVASVRDTKDQPPAQP